MASISTPFIWRHRHQAWVFNTVTGAVTNVYNVDSNIKETNYTSQRITNSNPLWLKQVMLGQNASTAYRRYETSLNYLKEARARQDSKMSSVGWVPRSHYSNLSILRGLPPTLVTDATLRDQALARVKRRINNMTETYQSLIPLAELRELRGLVGSLTGVTTDTVKMIADLKRTKGRSLFSHVSKLWLTYSFGVRPMMADLKDLSNSIWTYLTSGDKKSKVTGTASKEWTSYNNSWNSTTGGYLMPARYRSMTRSELSYRFVGAWKFALRSSNDYSALAHFGVTPPALIPALWETTMFSWVADYFGTLGDFLEDQFVGHAGESVYFVENRLYRARTQTVVEHVFATSTAAQTITPRYNIPGGSQVERLEFERTPLSSLPSRIIRWKTMDEVGLNSISKLLNLSAVLLAKK